MEGVNDITHSKELLRVLEAPELYNVFEKIFYEDSYNDDNANNIGLDSHDEIVTKKGNGNHPNHNHSNQGQPKSHKAPIAVFDHLHQDSKVPPEYHRCV